MVRKLFICMALIITVQARTIRVPTDAPTVEAALGLARPGDVIAGEPKGAAKAAAGTTGDLRVINKSINIVGMDNITIRDFHILNPPNDGDRGFKVLDAANIKILNCKIEGVLNDAIQLARVKNFLVSGCQILPHRPTTYHCDGFEVSGEETYGQIEYCTVNWNGDMLMCGIGDPGKIGTVKLGPGNIFSEIANGTVKMNSKLVSGTVEVFNNVFYKCPKPFAGSGTLTGGYSKNNIFYDCGPVSYPGSFSIKKLVDYDGRAWDAYNADVLMSASDGPVPDPIGSQPTGLTGRGNTVVYQCWADAQAPCYFDLLGRVLGTRGGLPAGMYLAVDDKGNTVRKRVRVR